MVSFIIVGSPTRTPFSVLHILVVLILPDIPGSVRVSSSHKLESSLLITSIGISVSVTSLSSDTITLELYIDVVKSLVFTKYHCKIFVFNFCTSFTF